jgi:hypothetical protein
VTQAVAAPQIRRPTYREGQLLDVAELQAEQQSRSEALARHERNVHTPGIVTGLAVTPAAGPGVAGIDIQPGLALDGPGRYLYFAQPLTASLADGESVTVSVIWRGSTSQIELSDTAPPVQADRTQDAWPVVLGQATRSGSRVSVTSMGREELQLRATTLTAPAGGGQVVLGGQSGHSAQVLGVRLAGGGTGTGTGEATTVDADGTGHVSVDTSLAGEVQGGGRVVLDTPVPPPPAALPWSLYRATLTRPDKTVVEQLRLEVGEVKSGVDPHALELLVAQGGTGAVKELLRVDASGTVTIPGPITVEGYTTVTGQASPLPAAPTLSSLAAQEADLLAMAQVLLNQLTDTDLRAVVSGTPTAAGSDAVTYTLGLVNLSATAVQGIAAYETVIGSAGLISHQFIAQGIDLPAASTHDITRTVTAGPHPTPVTIAVLAVGVGQDGQPRTATLRFTASS